MIDEIRIPLPDKLIDHRAAITTLRDAGITIPSKWAKLDAQLNDYLEMKSPALTRLVDAVTSPSASDDRTVLRGLAVAEAAATYVSVAAVNNTVIDGVHRRMIDTITAVAGDLYKKASGMFDQAAQSFHACCEVCDPETSAQIVVGLEDPQRVAWQSAEQHAARLTLLLPVLATAASLAGIAGIDPDVDNHPVLIGLTVDTTNLHRRRLYESWLTKDGDGRTGRWGALAALGATIRALPDLTAFQPYRECKPLEHRQVEFQKGMYRNETIDPEDNRGVEPIDPRKPQKNRVTIV